MHDSMMGTLVLRPCDPPLQELDTNPEGKLMTCMDLQGASFSMFAGEVKVRRLLVATV